MKNYLKIQGFTFVELMVVLVISFIILTGIYYFTNTYKLLKKASNIDTLTWEASKTLFEISKAIKKAKGVEKNFDDRLILIEEDGNETVFYSEDTILWKVSREGRKILTAMLDDIEFKPSQDGRFITINIRLRKDKTSLSMETGVFLR